jgi:Co/Zn/Cd efflux system component
MRKLAPDVEAHAFNRTVRGVALGVLVVALALVGFALALGDERPLREGIDWIYDVLIYGFAALAFGRRAVIEKSAALTIAAVLAFSSAQTLWHLADKIANPRPVEPEVFGVLALASIVVALLILLALWRFRASHNALIQAVWLFARNYAIKAACNVGLGFSAGFYPQRWLEYALDVMVAGLLFQATYKIIDKSLHGKRTGSTAQA